LRQPASIRTGSAQTYAGVDAGSDLYACVNAKGGSGLALGPADFTGSQSAPTNDDFAPAGWTRLNIGNNSLNASSGANAWQTVPRPGRR